MGSDDEMNSSLANSFKEVPIMSTQESPVIAGLATELFRREHAEFKAYLEEISELVGKLHAGMAVDQKKLALVVEELSRHITPHAEWEERVLYPVVDRYAGGGRPVFTASMRYEHRIIARQLAELAHESQRQAPDARRFARHADHLLGLVAAHFEAEEEVLLTLLDSSMTAEEFRREVLEREHH
jgi:hemerythrin-like domain-containing protein